MGLSGDGSASRVSTCVASLRVGCSGTLRGGRKCLLADGQQIIRGCLAGPIGRLLHLGRGRAWPLLPAAEGGRVGGGLFPARQAGQQQNAKRFQATEHRHHDIHVLGTLRSIAQLPKWATRRLPGLADQYEGGARQPGQPLGQTTVGRRAQRTARNSPPADNRVRRLTRRRADSHHQLGPAKGVTSGQLFGRALTRLNARSHPLCRGVSYRLVQGALGQPPKEHQK